MAGFCWQYRSKRDSSLIIQSGYMKDVIDFALLFTLKTTRKAGGLQILRCQGIAVGNYSFTLDAPALRDEASKYILSGCSS